MDMMLIVLACAGGLLLLASILYSLRTCRFSGDEEWHDRMATHASEFVNRSGGGGL